MRSKYLPANLLKTKNLQQVEATGVVLFPARDQHDERKYEDLEEGWKMTQDMIDSMHQSDWLHNELQDPGLQQIIAEIATASRAVIDGGGGSGRKFKHNLPQQQRIDEATTHQERLLHKLQGDHPPFKSFLDKLLVLTGVLEVGGGQAEVNEGAMRQQQLVLKPLPPRFVAPTTARQSIKNKTDSDAHTKTSDEQGDGDDNNDDDASSSDSDESSSSSSSSTSSSSCNESTG
jgi:hypothetical protein